MSRTLSVECSAIPLLMGEPALVPVKLSGQEAINELFEYELLLQTPDALDSFVSQAIKLFAAEQDVQILAAQAEVQIEALKRSITMAAKEESTLKADRIVIEARSELIVQGGGSYARYQAGGIESGTSGSDVRHAATHSAAGPAGRGSPSLPTSVKQGPGNSRSPAFTRRWTQDAVGWRGRASRPPMCWARSGPVSWTHKATRKLPAWRRVAPMTIQKVLTDNGSQFTDRFTSKAKAPSGKHVFDLVCAEFGIEHRLIPPRHPQTNGMVERFNGRISELTKQTRFASGAELQTTPMHYLKAYNHHIPQRALKPLKSWQQKKLELSVKRIYENTGLDRWNEQEFSGSTFHAD